jgi:hypothetical protein
MTGNAYPAGIRPSPSGKKIYLVLWYRGEAFKEPLDLEPTPENIALAAEYRRQRIADTKNGRYCRDLKYIPEGIPDEKALRTAYSAMFTSARKRREYTLTKNDEAELIKRSGNKCELTGLNFSLFRGNASKAPFAPSLDRINSSEGYTFRNVRLVCVAANFAMNEWGEPILKALAEGYVSTSVFSVTDRSTAKFTDLKILQQ